MHARLLVLFNLLLLLLACVFLWETQAIAGILKIETKTTVEVAGDLLKVTVNVTNNGTAPAHNVQVHLHTFGQHQDSPIKPQLDSGRSETVLFEKTISGKKKGRYPLTVYVDFHDSNQYPFSALSGMTFHVDEHVNPDLIALAEDITLEKNGELPIAIKNLGPGFKEVLVSLILPKELSVQRQTINFEIGPRSEKRLAFRLTNFSALPGANYPIFCYIEYDLENTHYTAIAKAAVNIAKDENLFRRFRWLWIFLTIIMSAMLVMMIIRGLKKKSME